ncbi:hypothetical protein GCM10027082_24080 [Comamonas humi]
MRHPYRATPRTLNDAFGQPPSYYDPFEHYTKPVTDRLIFYVGLIALAVIALLLWTS